MYPASWAHNSSFKPTSLRGAAQFILVPMLRFAIGVFLLFAPALLLAEQSAASFPILAIQRSAGSDALLAHELTPEEQRLFKEIDARTAALPESSELSAYHEVAIRIGRHYGLSPAQSVAFFTRTTFGEFEP